MEEYKKQTNKKTIVKLPWKISQKRTEIELYLDGCVEFRKVQRGKDFMQGGPLEQSEKEHSECVQQRMRSRCYGILWTGNCESIW